MRTPFATRNQRKWICRLRRLCVVAITQQTSAISNYMLRTRQRGIYMPCQNVMGTNLRVRTSIHGSVRTERCARTANSGSPICFTKARLFGQPSGTTTPLSARYARCRTVNEIRGTWICQCTGRPNGRPPHMTVMTPRTSSVAKCGRAPRCKRFAVMRRR